MRLTNEHSRRAQLSHVSPVLQGWVNVSRVEMTMPDGVVVERHVEDHGSGVAVLPFDEARKVVLLISQPRAPVLLEGEKEVLEVIAGRLDDCAPEERIRQEAYEEGGLTLGNVELVCRLWSMPSISTERLFLYLAPYCLSDRVHEGGGDDLEHENITVYEFALKDVADMVSSGRILDAKTLVLIAALQTRRPELFM